MNALTDNPHVFRLYVVELQWQTEAALRAMDGLDALILEAYKQAISHTASILARAHKHAALPDLDHPGWFTFDRRQCFDFADEFLLRAATVSHILHPGPVRPSPKKDSVERQAWADDRGAALRQALDIELSAATETGVRNHVAHIDEKIDDWARRYDAAAQAAGVADYEPGIAYSDRIVIFDSQRPTIEKFGRQRALVVNPPTYIVLGRELNLQKVTAELEAVKRATDAWLEQYERARAEGSGARIDLVRQ